MRYHPTSFAHRRNRTYCTHLVALRVVLAYYLLPVIPLIKIGIEPMQDQNEWYSTY